MSKDARIVITPVLLLAALGAASCGSATTRPSRGEEVLRAEQFVLTDVPREPAADAPKPSSGDTPAERGDAEVPVASTNAPQPPAAAPRRRTVDDTLTLRSFVGKPDLDNSPAQPTDAPVVLESVIGQINGRPLFASEVLTPLDGQLRAEAEKVNYNRAAFQAAATSAIQGIIISKVRDELMLAEAQASLPLEVRQGLFAFLGRIQQNIVSTQAGSALQADEQLRESTGRTLQQEARDRLDQELIRNELRTKVLPRVNVPWRLIRQDYERNYTKYNKGTAVLRVIAMPAGDADAVRAAEEAIASKPFAEAARMEFNTFLRDSGGVAERELNAPFTESPLFAETSWDEAAWALRPGETSPPVRYGDKIAWIHLESLDEDQGVSLYDAQLEIESNLRNRKFMQERDTYFIRLLERGSFTDITVMVQEALAIATERYLPPRSQ